MTCRRRATSVKFPHLIRHGGPGLHVAGLPETRYDRSVDPIGLRQSLGAQSPGPGVDDCPKLGSYPPVLHDDRGHEADGTVYRRPGRHTRFARRVHCDVPQTCPTNIGFPLAHPCRYGLAGPGNCSGSKIKAGRPCWIPVSKTKGRTVYPATFTKIQGVPVGSPPSPHEVEPATSHNRHLHPHTRHPRRPFPVIPGPPQMSFRAKPRNLNRSYTIPNFPKRPPARLPRPRSGSSATYTTPTKLSFRARWEGRPGSPQASRRSRLEWNDVAGVASQKVIRPGITALP